MDQGLLIHEVFRSQRRTTFGRTILDEQSARRRDLCLTTHNAHNRETYMSSVGFEPTISADERQQTYTSDRVATGIGRRRLKHYIKINPPLTLKKKKT